VTFNPVTFNRVTSTDPTSNLAPPAAMTPDRYAELAHAIEAEIGKVIVGQRELVRAVLICLLAEGHVLLEGVPGLGKTQLIKTLGSVTGGEFSRVQFTPDLMPADITGTQVLEDQPDGRKTFAFRQGPIFANLVLADEINRATPKTQSALLEAMQERTVTAAGETRRLPQPFLVMATQNPIESEGTYPLPEAQLDRFLMKAIVRFPTAEELVDVVNRTTAGTAATANQVVSLADLHGMIRLTPQTPAATHVVRHAVDLVMATHPDQPQAAPLITKYVRNGASPRGAQSLILAAKAAALIDGRPNASIDDIRSLAPSVLRHRLVVGYEAVADGVSSDQLITALLDAVPAPSAGLRGAPN
jgi:MoxR-like ATPase